MLDQKFYWGTIRKAVVAFGNMFNNITIDRKDANGSIIQTIYPKPEKDSKGALKKWENKVVLLDDLYHNSPTNANIKGTKWGAFNALTERLDYFRSGRGNSETLMAGASETTSGVRARVLGCSQLNNIIDDQFFLGYQTCFLPFIFSSLSCSGEMLCLTTVTASSGSTLWRSSRGEQRQIKSESQNSAYP